MKRLGLRSGLMIVSAVVFLSSLWVARATPRHDLLLRGPVTAETCPVVEPRGESEIDGCSPIPPTFKPMPTDPNKQPTPAPPRPTDLARQVTYEYHPRGQAISIQVEVQGTP